MAKQDKIRVWDPFVRFFHWGLVASVTLAGVTGFLMDAPVIDFHVWSGTFAVALVALRIVWGFFGGGFARFSDFIRGPRRTLAHLRGPHRHLGHNPLGGWMVLALMLAVLVLGLTGVLVLGGVFHAGPAGALMTVAQGLGLRNLHEVLAFILLALIAAHLAGVVFESLRTRENLARAMVTGRKAARAGDPPLPAGRAANLTAVLVGGGGLAVAGLGLAGMATLPPPAAPVPMSGSAYAKDCAECHIAYHPSLLPAASWKGLMATLDDHFGEDASIPAARAAEIAEYLAAHAAETADTKPARLFARVDPEDPGAITATPAWERIHDDLPEALFESAAVRNESNCAACHGDAESGWFYPGRIDIPEAAEAAVN